MSVPFIIIRITASLLTLVFISQVILSQCKTRQKSNLSVKAPGSEDLPHLRYDFVLSGTCFKSEILKLPAVRLLGTILTVEKCIQTKASDRLSTELV